MQCLNAQGWRVSMGPVVEVEVESELVPQVVSPRPLKDHWARVVV